MQRKKKNRRMVHEAFALSNSHCMYHHTYTHLTHTIQYSTVHYIKSIYRTAASIYLIRFLISLNSNPAALTTGALKLASSASK